MVSLSIAKIRHAADVRAMHLGIQIRHLEEDRVLVRGSQEDFVLGFWKIRVIQSMLPDQGPHPGGRGKAQISSQKLFSLIYDLTSY